MNQELEQMSNAELKVYIKNNRHDEEACHEALTILLSRRTPETKKYSHDLSDEEMESLFREKLRSHKSL